MRRNSLSNQGCPSKQSSAAVGLFVALTTDNFFQPFFTKTPIISKKEVHTPISYINTMCERERKIGDDFGCTSTPREDIDSMVFSLLSYYFWQWWSAVNHYGRLLFPDTVDCYFHRQRSTTHDYSGLLTTAVAVYYPRRWRSIVHRYRKSQSTVGGSSSPPLQEVQSTNCLNCDFKVIRLIYMIFICALCEKLCVLCGKIINPFKLLRQSK
jgi:hypothetical protein